MNRPAWWKNSRGEWYVVLQTILFALIEKYYPDQLDDLLLIEEPSLPDDEADAAPETEATS